MKLFIGVDIGKDALDIYCNDKFLKVSNNQAGFKGLNVLLQKESNKGNEIVSVVCEATGGYESKLVRFAKEKGIPIHVAHPNKVRKYAGAKGLLAKTDKIDAHLLSSYGEAMQVQPKTEFRSKNEELLVALLKRREQLKTDKVREELRLDKDLFGGNKKSIESHVKWLNKEIAKIEKQINAVQQESVEIKAKIDLLKTVPSVGNLTACLLVAFLPELGKTNEAKRIVSLAGLAPIVKESGKYRGKRFIQGGRAIVRRALYMSAVSSIRHYKEMGDFYLRLRGKGKTAKMSLVAVARKLLVVLNSVMCRCTPWTKEHIVVQAQ
jgi:transposase